ncbi:MAG: hypothetical protein ACR2PM_00340 [Hyphomicrobiales bacterium]
MRLVAWNCNMALHRKFDALLGLEPDIAVVSECAEPARLLQRGLDCAPHSPVWIGGNPNKGLGVFAFNGYAVGLAEDYQPTLRWVAPVHVEGPHRFNLLAVWAQNLSGGVSRKKQSGPLRRALSRYRHLLAGDPAFVAGDFNNNVIWDRPGWRINHAVAVAKLEDLGLVSAYHELHDEPQGAETAPTLYWRDRTKHGPTYHLDYIFVPRDRIDRITEFRVGSFEDWCGARLSDHVPVVVDIDL